MILFLGTIIFASLSILGLMNQATANGQNNYIIYDENKFKISLFLPLIFFILVSIIALFILASGKESYQFGDKLLSRKILIKGILLLIEIVQLFSWIIFLMFLITYFYPINKRLTQIYHEQVA